MGAERRCYTKRTKGRFDGCKAFLHGFEGVAFGHQQRRYDHLSAGEVGDDVNEFRRAFQTRDANIVEPAAAGKTFCMLDGAASLAADTMDGNDQRQVIASRRPASGWCLRRG